VVGVENVHLCLFVLVCAGTVGIAPLLSDTHDLLEIRRIGIDTDKPSPPTLFWADILRLLRSPIFHCLNLAFQFFDALFQSFGCHQETLPSAPLSQQVSLYDYTIPRLLRTFLNSTVADVE
jgi:hypothetical protein